MIRRATGRGLHSHPARQIGQLSPAGGWWRFHPAHRVPSAPHGPPSPCTAIACARSAHTYSRSSGNPAHHSWCPPWRTRATSARASATRSGSGLVCPSCIPSTSAAARASPTRMVTPSGGHGTRSSTCLSASPMAVCEFPCQAGLLEGSPTLGCWYRCRQDHRAAPLPKGLGCGVAPHVTHCPSSAALYGHRRPCGLTLSNY